MTVKMTLKTDMVELTDRITFYICVECQYDSPAFNYNAPRMC